MSLYERSLEELFAHSFVHLKIYWSEWEVENFVGKMEGEQRSAKDQKVISYLESRIRTYEKKAVQARRKVSNLDALSNRIDKQLQTYEKTLLRYNADDDDSKSTSSPLDFEPIS